MNKDEIIATGVLESYVLGTATEQEVQMVQDALRRFPELEAELEAIELSLLEYAELHTRKPSASVKDKLMQSIREEGKPEGGKVIPINQAKGNNVLVYRMVAAACFVLFVLSALMNMYQYRQTASLSTEMAQMKSQTEDMRTKAASQEEQMKQMNTQIAVLTNPCNKVIQLKGTPNAPEATATVYWCSNKAEVYMTSQLPSPAKGKQYQLWAIVDGKPVDAGMVSNSADLAGALQKMKNIPQAQAFAITLEEEGGSPVPTLTAMYVIGNI